MNEKHKQKDEFSNILVFNKYITESKLGEGSFGLVYSGMNVQTKEKEDRAKGINILETEAYHMSYLKGDGIPKLLCYGYNTKFNILIMERLGNSVEYFLQKCGGKFTLKTVLHLAVQMLERIEHVHNKNLVHRDLKPENFLTGYLEKEKNKIYLIDFGLCAKYRSASTKEHIPMSKGKSLTGTVRYASVNTHKGYVQSRRDDLESLGYIFIFFLKSSLPWQGLKAKTLEEKTKKILEKKSSIDLSELCSNTPKEFLTYLEYCRNLKFEAEPDYNYLNSLFQDLMKKKNFELNKIEFDWFKLNIDLDEKNDSDEEDHLNRSACNKTGIMMIDKCNPSVNISHLNHSSNELLGNNGNKQTAIRGGLKRKDSTSSNTSKKVSFGKIEIVTEKQGKSENGVNSNSILNGLNRSDSKIIVKELPKQISIKYINSPEIKSKIENTNSEKVPPLVALKPINKENKQCCLIM